MTKKSFSKKKTFVNFHTRICLHLEFALCSKEIFLQEQKVHIFKILLEAIVAKVKIHIQGPLSHKLKH